LPTSAEREEVKALGRISLSCRPRGDARRVRAFVVDDSATARKALRRMLAGVAGNTVVGEASWAEEVIGRIEEARPDVVVLDWRMPGMDGVEATRLLRESHPQLRVVGFTSSGDQGIHQAFLDAGAVAVFAKRDAPKLREYLQELVPTR
jgi:CheY-like chemotaxis protein